MAVIPAAKLPEQSQPWGRHIEQQTSDNSAGLDRLSQDTANTLQQLNASIGLLSKQISTLNTQQATLTAQQATLAAQQANILTLLGTQVAPVVGAGSSSGYVLGTGFAVTAITTITVPAGFTRAVIMASGYAGGASNSSGGDTLIVKVQVAGIDGPESRAILTTAYPFAPVSAFATVNLSGLTGGSTFNVGTLARLNSGPGGSLGSSVTSTIAVEALFLK